MADRDSFIDEVSEELRRDRMLRLWKRWGPWVIGALVVAVAAAGVAQWMQNREDARAREAGAALTAAARDAEPAAAFAEVAETYDGGVARIARLARAAALAEAGDRAAAIDLFDAVESDGAAEPLYRRLAGFKAAMLRAPDLAPVERAEAMGPFAAEGEPFRALALERRAAALIAAGDVEAARADIETALGLQAVSQALRQRLTEMQALLGDAR